MGILIGVFLVAVFMDLRCYRIPNLCIVVGSIAGFVVTYAAYSVTGVLNAVWQTILIFIFLYPFYLMRGLGAGDVKLIMMMGCYLQGQQLFEYVFVTMLIAGALSGIKMLCRKESRQRLFYLGRYIRKIAVTGTIDEYEIDNSKSANVIRLSIPAFLSFVIMCAGIY